MTSTLNGECVRVRLYVSKGSEIIDLQITAYCGMVTGKEILTRALSTFITLRDSHCVCVWVGDSVSTV